MFGGQTAIPSGGTGAELVAFVPYIRAAMRLADFTRRDVDGDGSSVDR